MQRRRRHHRPRRIGVFSGQGEIRADALGELFFWRRRCDFIRHNYEYDTVTVCENGWRELCI